jgi:hypothetical protein
MCRCGRGVTAKGMCQPATAGTHSDHLLTSSDIRGAHTHIICVREMTFVL